MKRGGGREEGRSKGERLKKPTGVLTVDNDGQVENSRAGGGAMTNVGYLFVGYSFLAAHPRNINM